MVRYRIRKLEGDGPLGDPAGYPDPNSARDEIMAEFERAGGYRGACAIEASGVFGWFVPDADPTASESRSFGGPPPG